MRSNNSGGSSWVSLNVAITSVISELRSLFHWKKSRKQYWRLFSGDKMLSALLLTDFSNLFIIQLAPLVGALSYCWSDCLKLASKSFILFSFFIKVPALFQTVSSSVFLDGSEWVIMTMKCHSLWRQEDTFINQSVWKDFCRERGNYVKIASFFLVVW